MYMSTVLENISKEIKNTLKRDDIAMAHRLGLFSKTHAQPPIIAQFDSYSVKEMWLAAARKEFYTSAFIAPYKKAQSMRMIS